MASVIISRMTGGRCCFAPASLPPTLWPHNSTGLAPGPRPKSAASPSIPIRPAIFRGRLYFQVADVLFPTFAQAATAWSAAEAHQLGIADQLDELIAQRTEALAQLRNAGADMEKFRAASRREAELAAQIRQLRAEVGHG